MPTAHCERAVSTKNAPLIRVISGQSITMESKGTDASLKINFNVNNNNYPLMFYFLRFFKKGTAHRIVGGLNVSAFIFDDSTKPYASVRVGVESIAPIRELDFSGRSIGAVLPEGYMPINEKDIPLDREYKKLKFLIYKYTWENWDNINLVAETKAAAIKEVFADQLEDLYFELVDDDIIMSNCNPVATKEKAESLSTKKKCSRRKVIEKTSNKNILPTDFSVDELKDFDELMDDSIPFLPSLFIRPGTRADNHTDVSDMES